MHSPNTLDENTKKRIHSVDTHIWDLIKINLNASTLTEEDLTDFGFCKWKEDKDLWLIPYYLGSTVPPGISVYTIPNGETPERTFKFINMIPSGIYAPDHDIRLGYLGCGIKLKKNKQEEK